MTDQRIALDGRTESIDLTDGALTHAPEFEAGRAGGDVPGEDGSEEDGGRGRTAAMAAGAITLAVGILFGMRWARKRRSDTTVVILDEPEAARWRQLLQRGGLSIAA